MKKSPEMSILHEVKLLFAGVSSGFIGVRKWILIATIATPATEKTLDPQFFFLP
jgi:hypothetical protein